MTYEERKAQVSSYLGKTVTIKIDRPIGSVHPKHPDIVYTINYGYIPGVLGGDGEELDVYIVGIDKPLDEFTGRIIGIIHRENDVEDKLVAASEGRIFYQNEIAEAVNFQEQYYITTVEGLYQKSCGAILYRETAKAVEYLLLFQKRSQTWSFPKGHMEIGETEEQTALREVFEETGLKATLSPKFREEVFYQIDNFINRKIVLFLSEVADEPIIRENEIQEYRWIEANEAKCLLYPEYARLIDKISLRMMQRSI
ncbi:MAG: NUDIX domain-containing protein [Clostridia bacterium]